MEVFLYKLKLDENALKNVLQIMLGRMNEIRKAPEFYHTLVDNCAVSLWRYTERLRAWQVYLHPRLILPGFSDRLAYNLDLLDSSAPFEELRALARINPERGSIEDDDFSSLIRSPD